MQVLFAVTLFVSALLLFFVQPLIAKTILPYLGGSPAVWNTCMVFFQSALLAGYAFVHFVSSRLSHRLQVVVQAALLVGALALGPLGLASGLMQGVPHDANPIPWLLELLTVSVGFPFFVLATSAPLLQKWFAATGHPSARDPYFLYGASNLGSMVALLGYPLIIEPQLALDQQNMVWTMGYRILVLLVLACGILVLRSPSQPSAVDSVGPPGDTLNRPSKDGAPSWRLRLRWLALAFVPSSLLLGVTNYFSTDIAAIPLLWIVPLVLYLLSFVLVFSQRIRLPYSLLSRVLAVSTLLATIVLLSEAEPEPVWVLMAIHLVLFFVAALVCHGELAQSRPPARYLSEFYLWMSLGGVLGGFFNALVAPLIFDRIAEYPLAMVLACLCRPRGQVDEKDARVHRGLTSSARPSAKNDQDLKDDSYRISWPDLVFPAALGLLTAILVLTFPVQEYDPSKLRIIILLALPAVICYFFVHQPVRFALGVGAIMLASSLDTGMQGRSLHRERNFFGTLRITRDPKNQFNQLVHGNTLHGRQYLDEAQHDKPLSYYHRTGPAGVYFQSASPKHVAVVGLGVGSLAAYARIGQEWTFYEIDPAVDRIARDAHDANGSLYFTFLHDHQDQVLPTVLGDARLRLHEAPEHGYDVIVLDAFTSDAIPVHLLTQQAFELYQSKLMDKGVILINISNRYLDLQPVLGNLTRHNHWSGYAMDDTDVSSAERDIGKEPSIWAILSPSPLTMIDPRWKRLPGNFRTSVWTDDFSNIWSVFRWK
jgi:spermidine synthase